MKVAIVILALVSATGPYKTEAEAKQGIGQPTFATIAWLRKTN
jgi:hypothetical protein